MARWDRFFDDEWKKSQDEGGLWANSGKGYRVFWDLRFLKHMGTFTGDEYKELAEAGVKIVNGPYKDSSGNIISMICIPTGMNRIHSMDSIYFVKPVISTSRCLSHPPDFLYGVP